MIARAVKGPPVFVGRTLFLEGGGTLTIGGQHDEAPGGLALAARGHDGAGFAQVWTSVAEARAFALELLRRLDEKVPRARLEPEARADGSAFDPHPLDALTARTLGPLDCRRDGCGCTFEAHEEGRCVNVKGGVRCGCMGFVGTAPEGRGHVPVSAR